MELDKSNGVCFQQESKSVIFKDLEKRHFVASKKSAYETPKCLDLASSRHIDMVLNLLPEACD